MLPVLSDLKLTLIFTINTHSKIQYNVYQKQYYKIGLDAFIAHDCGMLQKRTCC